MSSANARNDEDDAERTGVVVVARGRRPAPEHEPQAEVGQQRDRADRVTATVMTEDVVVLHVAELVGEHAFELDPVHLLEQAGGDRDRRVLRVPAGRERVRRGVVDDVEPRLRQPGRDAQALDEVVVAPVLGPVGRLRATRGERDLVGVEVRDERQRRSR